MNKPLLKICSNTLPRLMSTPPDYNYWVRKWLVNPINDESYLKISDKYGIFPAFTPPEINEVS